MKKILIFLFIFFFASSSFGESSLSLIDKILICKNIKKDFILIQGFKFINDTEVQILTKNTDTPEILTNSIASYKENINEIYIQGKGNITYSYTIYRDTLDVNGGLSLLFAGNQCSVHMPLADDFVLYFKVVYAQELLKLKLKKKI